MITLANGVYLNVLPTKKYKTLRINMRFATPLKETIATKRTLLSSLLETNSEKYPTQTAVSKKLEELYGATFGLQVVRKGNVHFLTVVLNVVNDKFLNTEGITKESIAFLKEMIYHPKATEKAFDKETFEREQENLASYMDSIYEDKQSYASHELQKLYFKDPNQQVPSYGTKEELMALTPEGLFAYYQKMLAKDQIVITMVGDITEENAQEFWQDFPFTDRKERINDIFYEQARTENVEKKEEAQPLLQSKLHLGYQIPDVKKGKNYFTSLVFNGILGGFPHSKLFMNVREKESLAYYASSGLDLYRQFLTVQTGIDVENKSRVEDLIAQQLKAIQKGDITPLEIEQTKANLKNHFLMQLDTPQGVIENSYRQFIFKEHLTPKEWLEALMSVTKEDVLSYSHQVYLQSCYFLKGEKVDA